MNANLGCDIINVIYNADYNNDIYGSSQNVSDIKKQNDMLKILFLTGLIANLEEKIAQINRISLLNLNYYKTSFEKFSSRIDFSKSFTSIDRMVTLPGSEKSSRTSLL